jgi:predicted DNA-binding antitoxin AbrB/MazE fold protein
MTIRVQAVFIDGVFRPLHPVEMADGMPVSLTVEVNPPISEADEDLRDIWDLLDHEYMEECRRKAGHAPSIEEVRRLLSGIKGSLADDIIAEREDRF